MTLTYLLLYLIFIPIRGKWKSKNCGLLCEFSKPFKPVQGQFHFFCPFVARGSLKCAPFYFFPFGHMKMLKEERSFYK